MNDSENIKALIPVVCPHCEKTLVVEFLIGASLLDQKATEDVLKTIESKPEPAAESPVEKPKEE